MAAMAAMAWCCVSGCGAPPDQTAVEQPALAHGRHHNPNPALFEKDARPFGVSMERLAEDWWRWAYSMPMATNPNFDLTADCDQNQDGRIFFLPSRLSGNTNAPRSCNVPRHTAVVVPLPTLLNDYPCPDPTFQPAPGQTLFDFLTAGAKQVQDGIAEIDGTLDGVVLDDLVSYRVASDDLFHFTGDTSLQSFDSCITGSSQPAVVDSFIIVLKPLTPGPHVLTTRTVMKSGAIYGPRTMTLNVRDHH
jgi:hypothetical protein